ncbi:MAG TPA: CcdB family protein [Acetobacteraceae bacterium]|nr:CcdB family protein [Acetobacteraceae bacterium]
MARLDVYLMPGRHGHVLDVQAELLSHLSTRAVVPLLPKADAPPRIAELNPTFDLNGEPHVMVTQAIASVPVKELKQAIASLGNRHDDVTRALDILLTGF